MPTTDIFQELDRAEAALDRPTLRLLRQEWASFALSVFRTCFSQDEKQIECDRLHRRVDGIRRDFNEAGRSVPPHDGRTQCRLWRDQRWLQRVPGDDDEQFYELTSSALEAIGLLDTLSADRPLISESRIKTIMDRIRICALQASDDPSERMRRLDDEIDRLTYELARIQTERDRIRDGGPVIAVENGQMREEYDNVTALLGQLPRDFQRIEESLGVLRREIIGEFQAETRSKGEILGSYLQRTDNLLLETLEGKAFDGALTVLQNDRVMHELNEQLAAIVEHPFAAELSPAARRAFLNAADLLRLGTRDVQTQQWRSARMLKDHIQRSDAIRERELREALTTLNRELATWMQTARPRADRVPIDAFPQELDLEYLKSDFHDPRDDRPAPPLSVGDAEADDALSLEEILALGGPRLGDVRAALTVLLAAGAATSLTGAFNRMDPKLRRPVEVFGLLHIAFQADLTFDPEVELAETIRPDGTAVVLEVPRIAARTEDVAER